MPGSRAYPGPTSSGSRAKAILQDELKTQDAEVDALRKDLEETKAEVPRRQHLAYRALIEFWMEFGVREVPEGSVLGCFPAKLCPPRTVTNGSGAKVGAESA